MCSIKSTHLLTANMLMECTLRRKSFADKVLFQTTFHIARKFFDFFLVILMKVFKLVADFSCQSLFPSHKPIFDTHYIITTHWFITN